MTPINRQTIESKLVLLEKNVSLLRDYRCHTKKTFLADPMLHGAVMHYLVESIEIIIDIGNHILAQKYGQSQSTYKDVIIYLGKHRVIPQTFAQRQMKMSDFRNLIIHGYGDIKLADVYRALQEGPDTFEQFARYFTKCL